MGSIRMNRLQGNGRERLRCQLIGDEFPGCLEARGAPRLQPSLNSVRLDLVEKAELGLGPLGTICGGLLQGHRSILVHCGGVRSVDENDDENGQRVENRSIVHPYRRRSRPPKSLKNGKPDLQDLRFFMLSDPCYRIERAIGYPFDSGAAPGRLMQPTHPDWPHQMYSKTKYSKEIETRLMCFLVTS